MHRTIRLLLAVASSAAFLAAVVGSASANNLSVSDKTSRMVWSRWEIGSSSGIVSCAVTMEGSFHSSTIRKGFKALIGHITRAGAQACTGGTATVRKETLPWNRTYMNFRGTLPRVTSIFSLFQGTSIDITTAGITCGIHTEGENNAVGSYVIEAGGRITSLRWEEATAIRPSSGGFPCELTTFTFRGSGTYTRLGATTSATLTLI